MQPERDWYAGRALAESAKTLAWRFAAKSDPFFGYLEDAELRAVMRERLSQIAEKGKDRITLTSDKPDITGAMVTIRQLPFEQRRGIYIELRVRNQRSWYANKAHRCKKFAWRLRMILIAGEVAAVIATAGRAFGAWPLDVSGILAALVASGAAWYSLRQYSSLASAYSVASAELAMAIGRLQDSNEEDWSLTVADTEEAISREHTMWLASRTGAT